MDDSVVTCDKIIDAEAKSYNKETKTIQTHFNEKTQILLGFLLIIIALLITVSIYCYLIKYQQQQQKKKAHQLPFHITNNELKQAIY